MSTSIIGVARSEPQALGILAELRRAGFTPGDVSILVPDKETSRDFACEKETKAPEGAAVGAGGGAAVGGALGWLAGIGTLSIPGLGPFIAAGPILAALAGVALGGAVGWLTGALVGAGIPEYEAKRYTGKIVSGAILISVHTEGKAQRTSARAAFDKAGAADVAAAREARV